jgi:uroporphyrinogen decarboxylase
MDSSRERMRKALDFSRPDRIPLVYHPSPAGLNVHGKKLLDLFNAYPPDNPVRFDAIPEPPAGTIDSTGAYRERRRDAWGVEFEYSTFGIQGIPCRFPFDGWEQGMDYEFPPLPSNAEEIQEHRKRYLIFEGGVAIFERLHALQPFEQVLIDIHTRDPRFLRFLDRLTDYWCEYIDVLIESGADVIFFGDDWGTQTSSIISPVLFREVFLPRYARLFSRVKNAGKMIFLHSCGDLSDVLGDFVAEGINGLWPQIGFFEQDRRLFEFCEHNRVTLYIHPDRQHLVPLGSPDDIERTITGYAEKYHRLGGGGIFYVEIENDAPFENIERLILSIDRYR